jgi:hypothetical protein
MLPPFRPLETKRLHLRPLAMSDAPAVQRRFAVWAVVKLLPGSYGG